MQPNLPALEVPRPVVLDLDPFIEAESIKLPEGLTLLQMLEITLPDESVRPYCSIYVAGNQINREYWNRVRPKPGAQVVIEVLPGNTGGQRGKSPLRTFLLIAVVAAAFAIPAALPTALTGTTLIGTGATALTVGKLISAGITVAGGILVNAIAPPPTPKTDQLQGGSQTTTRDSPTLFVSGTRNQALPFGVVPRVLGRRRMTPNYGALPATDIEGDQQYLRAHFDFGYGPLQFEELKIGETPIENFDEVEYEIRQGYPDDAPLTLYPEPILEESFNVILKNSEPETIRRSENNADELSVDCTWFRGLIQLGDSPGERYPRTVDVAVRYKLVGTSQWLGAEQSFGARTSPALAPEAEGRIRDDMVTIDRGSGDIVIFRGSSVTAGEQPPVPKPSAYLVPLAQVRRSGTDPITDADITDARQPNCPCFNPKNDFTVTATMPASDSVKVGSGTLRQLQVSASAKSTSAVRRSIRWGVPRGQYDVSLKRLTPDLGDTEIEQRAFDETTFSALRTVRQVPVTNTDHPTAQIALRIKATEELNGTVDSLNAVVTSILPAWNGSTWVEQPTRDPAAMFREVLTGPANARRVTVDRLMLSRLQEWSDFCKLKQIKYDMIIDFRDTVPQLLRDITGIGRASLTLEGNQYSVVIDKEKPVITGMFTPRNSREFQAKKPFAKLPEGFRVKFFNEEVGYQPDERLVFREGFDETNATLYEVLDLAEVTDPAQAARYGLYRFSDLVHRSMEYSLTTNPEYLAVKRGARVALSYDIISTGIASGRIKILATNAGGDIVSMTSDEALEVRFGVDLGIVVRYSDNAQELIPVEPVAEGEYTHTLIFKTPIPSPAKIAVGDLFQYGIVGSINRDVLLHSIEPRALQEAKLTFKNYAPPVLVAGDGPVPPFESNLTPRAGVLAPAVINVRSDESVLLRTVAGDLVPRILVTLGFLRDRPTNATGIQLRYKESDDPSASYSYITAEGFAPEIAITDVITGQSYVIQVRYVRGNDFGAWGPPITETVIGTSTLPPDVPDLFRDNTFITWNYPNPPQDFRGFEIRQLEGNVANWKIMIPIAEGLITETRFSISSLVAGLRTIGVKAVDWGGNESANMARIVLDLGDTPIANIVDTDDKGALGYPGEITNGTVSGPQLLADVISDLYLGGQDASNQIYLPNDGRQTVPGATPNPDELYLEEPEYEQMTYITQTQVPAEEIPTGVIPPTSIRLNPVVQGFWEVFYRTGVDSDYLPDGGSLYLGGPSADDDPYLPVILNSDYNVWPGSIEIRGTTAVFEFKLVTEAGQTRGIVDEFKVIIDAPDQGEFVGDFVVPSGGGRVPLTESYREIRSVVITVQDDGGDAFTAKALDKDPTLGPLMQCYRQDGQPTAGTLDIFIGGIAGTPP